MADTESLRCIKCNRADCVVECTFCEMTLYCSKACEAEDLQVALRRQTLCYFAQGTDTYNSNSHRDTCAFKARNLRLQSHCAACPAKLLATNETCNSCQGIKYCSAKCMADNADEHGVVCQTYVDLPPRPSQEHRLHLMLPFQRHPVLGFGFVWRKDLEEAKHLVVGGLPSRHANIFSLGGGSDWRSTAAYYALDSDRNEVLGGLVSGRPTQHITGSFSIFATECSDDYEAIGDVLPSDLHDAVYRVSLMEVKYGGVKTALDPSLEKYYGGGSV